MRTSSKQRTSDISLLLLDADGRIDRDLALLFGRLAPSAALIIDDLEDSVHFHNASGAWVVDQKHRLGHFLCEAFAGMGLIVPENRIAQTGFFRKGAAQPAADAWRDAAREAYARLVFAPLDPGVLSVTGAVKRLVRRHLDDISGVYRRRRP